MIEVIRSALVLGFDGFIACTALGVTLPKRARVLLAVAFGVCDSVASALGVMLPARIRDLSAFDACSLLGCCVAFYAAGLALVASAPRHRPLRARFWFALPLLMSLDNLVLGAGASLHGLALSSLIVALVASGLALCGLKVGASLADLRWAKSADRSAA